MSTKRGFAALVTAWLLAGFIAGVHLHREGGVFGEAVPLGASIAVQLVSGIPWVVAAVAAWIAAGRWPIDRREILRPVTLHAALGLCVVLGQQILLAALRQVLLPPGLRPLNPWALLPEDLTFRAPPALVVYAVLVGVALVWRSGRTTPQDVPAAGRPGPRSS